MKCPDETENNNPTLTDKRKADSIDGTRGKSISSTDQVEAGDLGASDLDFLCAFCVSKFSSRGSLVEHVASQHAGPSPKRSRTSSGGASPEDLPMIKKEMELAERFSCHLCEYQSDAKANLLMHVKNLHSTRDNQESTFKAESKDSEGTRLFPTKAELVPKLKLESDADEKKPDVSFKPEYVCDQCQFKCSVRTNLVRHMKIFHTSITCKLCWAVLPSQEEFKQHLKERHTGNDDSQKLVCDTCSYSTTQRPYLERHIRSVHHQSPFVCNSCQQRFSVKRRLLDHHRATRIMLDKDRKVVLCQLYTVRPTDLTRIQRSYCKHCTKRFPTLEETRNHFKEHHPKMKDFNCNHCGEDFKKPNLIYEHLLWYLKKDFESVIKYKKSDPELKYNFEDDSNLSGDFPTSFDEDLGPDSKHNVSLQGETLVCPDQDCNMKCENKFGLKHHIQTSHCKEKKFMCEFCSTKFVSENELKSHANSNQSSDSNGIMNCSKYLTISSSPAYQITEDKENNRFQCQLCNFSSESKSMTMAHLTDRHKGFGYQVCSKCRVWAGTKRDVIEHWSVCQA